MSELTREDWIEIYYALDSKKKGVEAGEYGAVARARRAWADHLGQIMDTIGEDGENMTEEKTSFYLVAIDGDVEAGLHGPWNTHEERDAEAKRMRNRTSFEGGLYPLEITGSTPVTVEVDTFSAGFFMDDDDE